MLVLILLVKKLWNRFPVFLAYSVFCFATAAGLYAIRGLPFAYFYAYWMCEGLGLLLGLGVIYEVFKKLLHPYAALHRMAAIVFQLAAVLLIGSSCVVAYVQPSAERSSFMAGILVAEEATRIIEIGLLVFLFIFARVFGLHWRQQLFGIALGLGLFVAVELIVVAVRAHLGIAAAEIFSAVRMMAFNLSLLIWIGYLLAPERVTSPAEMPKRAQLEQWNRAIMELINQ